MARRLRKGGKYMHQAPVIVVGGLHFDLALIAMTLITMIVVMVIAGLGARKLSVDNPGKMQNFLEWVLEFVMGIVGSTLGSKRGRPFVMLGITLLMFIFVSNLLGLPFYVVSSHHHPFSLFGYAIVTEEMIAKATNHEVEIGWWKSPTADASVTLGLAGFVILMSHYLGIVKNTRHYFKHYLEPFPAFLPINLIEQISKLLTLALRLFGNIFAGEVMIAVILKVGIFGIIPLIVWQAFSTFIGSIQAFIFTTLTMVYLSQMVKHEEAEQH
jgi:F-type H+-transporting ATPase subunit a